MNLVGILALDKYQVRVILENHEMFEPDEVRLAAKQKVKFDRQDQYELRSFLKGAAAQREINRSVMARCYQ